MCVYVCAFSLGALFAVCLLFFGDLAVQLLQNQSVKCDSLLRVIKYPISRYLPVNSRKIGEAMLYEFPVLFTPLLEMKLIFALTTGFSFSSEKLVNINKFVTSASSDVDLVFVVSSK